MKPQTCILIKQESPEKIKMINLSELDHLKLNLGCGDRTYPGYLNIDKTALPNVDLVWDLENTPLPLKTSSVSEIICEHILEHITNLMPLLEELHRICKPNARIFVSAPYYKYEAAYRDPTHVRFFTEHSFDYLQDNVKFSHYSKARFKVKKVKLRNHFISSVKNFHKKIIKFIPFKKILNHFMWNMYSEINYELQVIKEEAIKEKNEDKNSNEEID